MAAECSLVYALVDEIRQRNEDNFLVMPDHHIFAVADGMGGHASGEVASKIAVETLANFFIDTSRDREVTWPYKEDKSLNYDQNLSRVIEASSFDDDLSFRRFRSFLALRWFM